MSTNVYKQSDSKRSNRHTGKMEHGKILIFIDWNYIFVTYSVYCQLYVHKRVQANTF